MIKIKSSGLGRGLCEVALDVLLERGGARGTRTLTALRPGDFKSPMSTISSSPLGWLPYYVGMILTCYKLFVNHLMSSPPGARIVLSDTMKGGRVLPKQYWMPGHPRVCRSTA